MNVNFNITISLEEKQFNRLLNLITTSKDEIMATQAELEVALNETKTEVQGLRSQLVAIDQRLEAVLANPPVDLAAAMQLVADIRAEIAGAGTDAAKIEVVG
jgi:predicted DNA-binding ArsR family transcriptional regulator